MLDFWWLFCLFFIGGLAITIFHAVLSKVKPQKETTVIQVQSPKFMGDSPAITINITHHYPHLTHRFIPPLNLPPAVSATEATAVNSTTKKEV
jgi:hypothetical protein